MSDDEETLWNGMRSMTPREGFVERVRRRVDIQRRRRVRQTYWLGGTTTALAAAMLLLFVWHAPVPRTAGTTVPDVTEDVAGDPDSELESGVANILFMEENQMAGMLEQFSFIDDEAPEDPDGETPAGDGAWRMPSMSDGRYPQMAGIPIPENQQSEEWS